MMDHRGEIANRLKLSHEKLFICTMIFTNYLRLFEENMKTMKLDAYTKKINYCYMHSFMKRKKASIHSVIVFLMNGFKKARTLTPSVFRNYPED